MHSLRCFTSLYYMENLKSGSSIQRCLGPPVDHLNHSCWKFWIFSVQGIRKLTLIVPFVKFSLHFIYEATEKKNTQNTIVIN